MKVSAILYRIREANTSTAFSETSDTSSINPPVISKEPRELKSGSPGLGVKSIAIISEPFQNVIVYNKLLI